MFLSFSIQRTDTEEYLPHKFVFLSSLTRLVVSGGGVVCGVVVSGGEGVQRKVVVGKAVRFSCT